jgi:REP element-mobilizing transposase RayT
MPRSARIDTPGVLHHIIIRGIEKRKIFRDDKDRDDFIARLSVILPETKTSCYAWALMSNHAHFLFRSGEAGISKVMRRLLTGYAVSFNHKYKRHGQLFQNRYKSIICQEDAYLKELVRYIHLNPLRAHIVSDLQELKKYPYSGHGTIMGKSRHTWQDTGYVLSYFGKDINGSRRAYLEFIKGGIEQGRRPELVGGGMIRSLGGWEEVKARRLESGERIKGDERILGDSGFVLGVLSEAEEAFKRKYRLKSAGYNTDLVERRVLKAFDIKKEELYSGSRRKPVTEARSVFCYWCVIELGESMTGLAKRLGLSQPTIGYSVERGKEIAAKMRMSLTDKVS